MFILEKSLLEELSRGSFALLFTSHLIDCSLYADNGYSILFPATFNSYGSLK